MKKIEEISETEAKEIFSYVFPAEDPKNKYYSYTGLSLKPVITEQGQQVTFGFKPNVGILYYNGQDRCVLHFDNTKVVLWLYNNGYDIKELLEANAYLSEMEHNFDILGYGVYCLSLGEEGFREEVKHNWTLEYVKREAKKLYDKYYIGE